jgi:hypothetical protein
MVEPDSSSFEEAIGSIEPHIIFGNSYDIKIAGSVPVRIHASFPAYDHIYKFDGTPFVGLRGHAYLTQTLVNALNQSPEVFRD